MLSQSCWWCDNKKKGESLRIHLQTTHCYKKHLCPYCKKRTFRNEESPRNVFRHLRRCIILHPQVTHSSKKLPLRLSSIIQQTEELEKELKSKKLHERLLHIIDQTEKIGEEIKKTRYSSLFPITVTSNTYTPFTLKPFSLRPFENKKHSGNNNVLHTQNS